MMKPLLILFLAWIAAPVSTAIRGPVQKPEIMLAGFSRDDSMFGGGLTVGGPTRSGKLSFEPITWITPDGAWKKIPCNSDYQAGCRQFAHDYLSHRHMFRVVSAEGWGATVLSEPVSLGDCYDFDGMATYSGASISGSGIAASSDQFFASTPPPQPLQPNAEKVVRKGLASLIPRQLDSLKYLRLFSLELGGQHFVIVQRALEDYEGEADSDRRGLIFAIGQIRGGQFRILHWKKDTEDEEERILGTFKLRNGQEYLVTVRNDPESQSFQVYAVRSGKLQVVFSGGGASC